MFRIMIIRHAEKHYEGGAERGVDIHGEHAKHELTVRGWMRAGALVPFFAPAGAAPANPLISTPRSIFASAAVHDSPSLRAQHTVTPLAALLGLEIDASYADGHEHELITAALSAASPVLIDWHHSHIVRLTRLIGGERVGCPDEWPEERFDLVWVLDREGPAPGPWRFAQATQRLFAYDRTEPI
jgi:hypothetical protein